MDQQRKDIHERFNDDGEVDEAVIRAVRNALAHHKKKQNHIAVWKDDKVVVLPPDEITTSEEVE